MDPKQTLSWKLPKAVATAAVRGNACTTDETTRMIGQMVRRELDVGVGEENKEAMILLGERVVYEVQKRWVEVEDALAKHMRGLHLHQRP